MIDCFFESYIIEAYRKGYLDDNEIDDILRNKSTARLFWMEFAEYIEGQIATHVQDHLRKFREDKYRDE